MTAWINKQHTIPESRVFNVDCEGTLLPTNQDMVIRAGGGPHVMANADGPPGPDGVTLSLGGALDMCGNNILNQGTLGGALDINTPLSLIIGVNKNIPQNPFNFVAERIYWDTQTSPGIAGDYYYETPQNRIVINSPGTYDIGVTLITQIENSSQPYDSVSLNLITPSFIAPTETILITHNTPNATDSIGASSAHSILVISQAQLPYYIESYIYVTTLNNPGGILVIGRPPNQRATNLKLVKISDEVPLPIDVSP